MGDIYRKATDGTVQRARDLYVKKQDGTAAPVKVAYVLQSITQLTLDPPTYEYNWKKVRDYEPPTEIPPAPSLGAKDQMASTLDTECTPQQYQSPDVRSTYVRQIGYELNGAVDARLASLTPTQIKDIQTWTAGDNIRARVRFLNDAGAGPWGAFSTAHTVIA